MEFDLFLKAGEAFDDMKEKNITREELMRNLADRHCEKAGKLYDSMDLRYVYSAYCAGWEAAIKTIWRFANNEPENHRWLLVRLKSGAPVAIYTAPKAWSDIQDRALYWCYLEDLT